MKTTTKPSRLEKFFGTLRALAFLSFWVQLAAGSYAFHVEIWGLGLSAWLTLGFGIAKRASYSKAQRKIFDWETSYAEIALFALFCTLILMGLAKLGHPIDTQSICIAAGISLTFGIATVIVPRTLNDDGQFPAFVSVFSILFGGLALVFQLM